MMMYKNKNDSILLRLSSDNIKSISADTANFLYGDKTESVNMS